MNVKHLSAFIVTGTIAFAASPAIADSSDAPQFNFSCKVSEGVPTTFAQPVGSDTAKPVFHWKQEALQYKSSLSPQELCNDVTAKLEEYSATGYDLSQISFVGTEQTGLPAICATTAGKRCSKVLFTLKASDRAAIDADNVVAAILNPKLQSEKTVYNDRGVQSTSYQVNFWQLLGLGPNKFFSK